MLRYAALARPKDIINTPGVPRAPSEELSTNGGSNEVRKRAALQLRRQHHIEERWCLPRQMERLACDCAGGLILDCVV
jgi:hypothetical protein